MVYLPGIALGCALVTSLAAAVTDSRSGTIPNSITLPCIVVAPSTYGFFGGTRDLLMSLAAAGLCGLVPYALFRARAMGGGDVKLFAALGALTGYDPFVGLQIELAAFVTALIAVVWSHARARRLAETLRSSVRALFGGEASNRLVAGSDMNVRLGRFVFVATAFHVILPLAAGSTS